MTLVMTELRDDFPPGPDPNFNPNLFSEDEEEVFQQDDHGGDGGRMQPDTSPPIAPMTPRPHHSVPGSTTGRFTAQPQLKSSHIPPTSYITTTENHHVTSETSTTVNSTLVPSLAKAESYEEEFPYVELTDVVHYCESLRSNSASCSSPNTVKNYIDSCTNSQVLPTSNTVVYTVGGNGVNSNASSIYSSIGSGVPQYMGRCGVSTAGSVGGSATQTTRHISPLMCDGSVPTLQSPKNAVAPSEFLIDRNPSSQTIVATATSSDHAGNVQRMKSVLAEQQSQNRNIVGLNLNLNLCTLEQNNIDLRHVVMKRVDNEGNINFSNKLHQLYNNSSSEGITGTDAVVIPTNATLHSASTSPMKPMNNNNNNSHIVGKRKEKHCSNKSSPGGNQMVVSGSKWCMGKPEDLLYIDEDGGCAPGELPTPDRGSVKRTPTTVPIAPRPPACLADSMVRSCSVGYLDLVDAQLVASDIALLMLRKEAPKRLVLVNRKNKQRRHKNKGQHTQDMSSSGAEDRNVCSTSRPLKLKHCGKSRSLDSSDIFPANNTANQIPSKNENILTELPHAKNKHPNQAPLISVSSMPSNSQETDQRAVTSKHIPLTSVSLHKVTKTYLVPPLEGGKNLSGNSGTELSEKLAVRETSSSQCHGADVLPTFDSLTAKMKCRELLEESRSLPPPTPYSSPRLPRSSPASPAPSKKSSKRNQSSSPIRLVFHYNLLQEAADFLLRNC